MPVRVDWRGRREAEAQGTPEATMEGEEEENTAGRVIFTSAVAETRGFQSFKPRVPRVKRGHRCRSPAWMDQPPSLGRRLLAACAARRSCCRRHCSCGERTGGQSREGSSPAYTEF